jgi:TP901 family phage tail tape measure protein
MATSIADLFVSVSADVSGAVNGLNNLGAQLNGTTQQFKTATPVALAFEAAAGSIAAGLGLSISTAADFQKQMSGVQAVMSPNEAQALSGALSDLALKLGRDTVFTSREAAAGIEELVKAGISAQDVLDGAGTAALSLAAATGIPVAQAATVAATAMNTFSIQASDLSSVVDLLAGTANASAADISQLQFGLQAVGPVASQMGLSLADTTAALGVFANNGLRGQDAGTSLKTMLLNLVPSTKKASNEFKQLGLITADGANVFFNAEGHLRSLADISQILQDALSGLTDEQRINTLQTLFGTDAVRAASILFKTGGDAVNQFHDEVGKVSAFDAAKTRLDNFDGAMQNLGGSLETVEIIIGNLFLPTLRNLADQARGVVDQFSTLSPETQKLVVFITAGVGAFLGLLGAFILIAPFLAALPAAFGALGAILAIVFGPIGLAVAAIALLGAGLIFAFQNSQQFHDAVLTLWDAIQNNLVPAIAATANTLAGFLGPIFDQISQLFLAFVSDAAPKVLQFFQTDLPNALATMGAQVATLQPLFDALSSFFGAMFNVIGSLAAVGGTALQGLFENVLVPGFQALQGALAPLQPIISDVSDKFGVMVANIGPLGAIVQGLAAFFNDAAASLNNFAVAIQNFQLPDFLKPGGGVSPAAPTGPSLTPASFTPGGGGGASGPLVNIGVLNVSDEASRLAFLNEMAAAIAGASRRAAPPPDNTGIPQLDTGTV